LFFFFISKEINIVITIQALYFQDLSTLTNLGISKSPLTEISGIKELDSLDTLQLNANKINDMSGLTGLEKLHYVKLESNQISKIAGSLPNLRSMSLRDNSLKSLDGFEGFPKIQGLDVQKNPLSDYSALYKESSLLNILWDLSSDDTDKYREVWNNIKKYNKPFFDLYKDNPNIRMLILKMEPL